MAARQLGDVLHYLHGEVLMSFLKALFGGSDSKQTQDNAATSGYASIPAALRSGFDQLGMGVAQYTNPNNPDNIARFTPLAQTQGETNAYNAINQGFTPTETSLNSDLSMLMNPFNDSVIGGINNQANSNYSILKQALDQAGQFGSNRQVLGANDIELQRQNQIGSLLQNQYNQALGQVFNNLVPQRQQDAMNQLNAGSNQRALDFQTKQAPIAALQAGTGMIAPFNSSVSSGSGYGMTNNYGNGMISGLGQLAGGIGAGMMLASDINLKENIIPKGIENGHNIYEFSYKGDSKRYIGVMAQEVQKIAPEAVIETPSGLAVNYDAIGVKFREVA